MHQRMTASRAEHVPPAVPIDPTAEREVVQMLASGGAVILSGAGMSTASGIPDYRGPDGTRRVQPMQYADFLASPDNRRRYWARSYAGWAAFAGAAPNPAHHLVADFQKAGFIHGVITQNVDGLHQRAGSDPVLELHGALDRVICLDCEAVLPREVLQRWLAERNPNLSAASTKLRPDGDVALDEEVVNQFQVVPCPQCASDRLKPDVVFFGGGVARGVVQRAYDWVDRADALVVLGSSLQVMSGLRFVRHASRRGIPVGVITRGPVRGADYIDVHLDALLGDALPQIGRALAIDPAVAEAGA